jgi:hypothetical protein
MYHDIQLLRPRTPTAIVTEIFPTDLPEICVPFPDFIG